MTEPPDNVLPFRGVRIEPVSSYCVPDDARDIVNLAADSRDGHVSVVVLSAPDGLWEIRDPDDVDRLALHLIQLACRMRGLGGPP